MKLSRNTYSWKGWTNGLDTEHPKILPFTAMITDVLIVVQKITGHEIARTQNVKTLEEEEDVVVVVVVEDELAKLDADAAVVRVKTDKAETAQINDFSRPRKTNRAHASLEMWLNIGVGFVAAGQITPPINTRILPRCLQNQCQRTMQTVLSPQRQTHLRMRKRN